MPLHTPNNPVNCNVRLPVHKRPGYISPLARGTLSPGYEHVLSIPDCLIIDTDSDLDGDDRNRMASVGNIGDPVHDYYGHPELQRDIIAEEKANRRLRQEKPYAYGALQARDRIKNIVQKTPIVGADQFIEAPEAHVWLKLDNIEANQRSFKARGAANALLQLTSEQRYHGVVAFSAGNHALGVALAAYKLGTTAHLYMPEGASSVKVDRALDLGAEVTLVGDNLDQARAACMNMLSEHPERTFIHPYNNEQVMSGQSSWAAEVFWQLPGLTAAYFPIGGGGFISKNAAALKEYNPAIEIVGVQLEGSDAAMRSKAAGKVVRIDRANPVSDGTAVTAPGELVMPFLIENVDRIVSVSEYNLACTRVKFREQFRMPGEAAALLAATAVQDEAANLRGTVLASVSGGNESDIDIRHAYELVGRIIS